jgi:hypothetical protein
MQELRDFGEIIDGVAENIKDDIFVIDFSQLINPKTPKPLMNV